MLLGKGNCLFGMNQNSLTCAEKGGHIATITQFVKDRLETNVATATRDEISISSKIITCMFTVLNKKLSCKHRLHIGLEFYKGSPSQILITLQPNTAVLGANSLTLQGDPRSLVYCAVPKLAFSEHLSS